MNNLIKYCIILLLSFFTNCSTNFFNEIPLIDYSDSDKLNIYEFSFYKSRLDIKKEFIEVAILSTDMDYYGNFFYDENFMRRLKDKVISLNANAVVYEKNKKVYKDYNEKLIYFTAIRLIEK